MRYVRIEVSCKEIFKILSLFIFGVFLFMVGCILFLQDKQYALGLILVIFGCFIEIKYFFLSKHIKLDFCYRRLNASFFRMYKFHNMINNIRDKKPTNKTELYLMESHKAICNKRGIQDEKVIAELLDKKLFSFAQKRFNMAQRYWQKLEKIDSEFPLLDEIKKELDLIEQEQRQFLESDRSFRFSISQKEIDLTLTPEGKLLQKKSPLSKIIFWIIIAIILFWVIGFILTEIGLLK